MRDETTKAPAAKPRKTIIGVPPELVEAHDAATGLGKDFDLDTEAERAAACACGALLVTCSCGEPRCPKCDPHDCDAAPVQSRGQEPPTCECGHSWGSYPYPGQRVGPPGNTTITDGSCDFPLESGPNPKRCGCKGYRAASAANARSCGSTDEWPLDGPIRNDCASALVRPTSENRNVPSVRS